MAERRSRGSAGCVCGTSNGWGGRRTRGWWRVGGAGQRYGNADSRATSLAGLWYLGASPVWPAPSLPALPPLLSPLVTLPRVLCSHALHRQGRIKRQGRASLSRLAGDHGCLCCGHGWLVVIRRLLAVWWSRLSGGGLAVPCFRCRSSRHPSEAPARSTRYSWAALRQLACYSCAALGQP